MTAHIAPSALTYAIGDIHGRADLLRDALGRIEAHRAGRSSRIVFLGDLVDRGPASRTVVEDVKALCEDGRAECVKGNHEAMMVEALSDGAGGSLARWLDNGGDATLAAYGWDGEGLPFGRAPQSHLRWMSGLPLTLQDDHRIYVHAGLAPGVTLAEQEPAACLWIREKFLRADAARFPAHVVHGHTPVWAGKLKASVPELLPHRTNLDTGAFATGVLAVGVFETATPGGPVEVLFARDDQEGARRGDALGTVKQAALVGRGRDEVWA